MKPTKRPLHLARETIRQLTAPDLRRAAGGAHPTIAAGCVVRDTPVTPECPSEPTFCVNSCSD